MTERDDALARVLSRLDGLVDWERRDRSAGMRVGLEPARALCAALGNPQDAFRIVHVAGSKGKGSTAAWIAAGLRRAGRRTGVYASPHVESITERVQIAGAECERGVLAAALELALASAQEEVREATWFDVVTAAAFCVLRDAAVDWAVVEVGLGGRLDSTNVVHPELCVLTNIELEHTAVLGDTREEIAAEKAGIAKPGVPLVCGMELGDPATEVVVEAAGARGAPWVLCPPVPGEGLIGRNRRLALAALAVLAERGGQPEIDPEVLVGAAAPELPGRLEHLVCAGIPVVLDGAHTPGSLELLLGELESRADLPGRPVVVFGAARDKPLTALLKLLVPVAEIVVCSSAGSGLALPALEVAQAAREAGLDVETASDPRAAIQRALALARSRWVLVTGSLHLVGHARSQLTHPDARSCSPSSPTCS